MSYSVSIPYKEFRYNFVETDEGGGPWGDDYFHSVFDKYIEDGLIEIDYRYGPMVNYKFEIIWKVSGDDTKKARKLRYGHSSPFAEWWCSLTNEDENEEDEDEDEDEEEHDIETTIVSGIICKACNKELPKMTMKEHLDGRGCPCRT